MHAIDGADARASCRAAPPCHASHQDRRGDRAGVARRRRGTHGGQPHGQRPHARGQRRRERQAVRAARRSPRRSGSGDRRCRCPARCRATCRRRSPRARAAISSAGPRTSAASVEQGELLAEIETPEIDQQLSAGRRARATRPRPAWRSPRARSIAGKACARKTWSRSRTSTSAAARVAQAAGQRRQRPMPTCSGCASSRASSAWWRRSPA